jgi:hypothetical protein
LISRLFLGPKQFTGTASGVNAVEFTVNVPKLAGGVDPGANVVADDGAVVATDKVESINAGLAFVSIGYLAEPVDHSLPFNQRLSVYENVAGRIKDTPGKLCLGKRQYFKCH